MSCMASLRGSSRGATSNLASVHATLAALAPNRLTCQGTVESIHLYIRLVPLWESYTRR
jgi:hypothetical protein